MIAITRISVLILVVAVLSCSEDIPTHKSEVSAFHGILEVDSDCQIIGEDTTDFQPRPEVIRDTLSGNIIRITHANYSLIYACPNPTAGNMTSIHFQVPEYDSVWIYAYDSMFRSPVDTIVNRRCAPGRYIDTYINHGHPGIYRIVMRAANGFVSYGDVRFNE